MYSTGRHRRAGTYRATATATGPDGVVRTAEVLGIATKGRADLVAAQLEQELQYDGIAVPTITPAPVRSPRGGWAQGLQASSGPDSGPASQESALRNVGSPAGPGAAAAS